MKRFLCLVLLFVVGCGQPTPQEEFNKAVKTDGYSLQLVSFFPMDNRKDQAVVEQFAPCKKGMIVLVQWPEGRKVELWTPQLLATVQLNGKAHTERFGGY